MTINKSHVITVFAPHCINATTNPNPKYNHVPNTSPNADPNPNLLLEAFTSAKTEDNRNNYLGMQLGTDLSTSQVENNFIGTGFVLAAEHSRPTPSAAIFAMNI